MSLEHEFPECRLLEGDAAPGWPGEPPTWAPGRKSGFGTSLSPASRVWFTLVGGAVTEVYYPNIDTACLRAMKLLVSDGHSFCEDEARHLKVRVRRTNAAVPAYRVEARSARGYWLRKDIITDPGASVLLMRVSLETDQDGPGPLSTYLHVDPHVNNSGWCDNAYLIEYQDRPFLLATDGGLAVAVTTTIGWRSATVGFSGRSDGLSELEATYTLPKRYSRAIDGNVAGLLEIELSAGGDFTVVCGFGRNPKEAVCNAIASMARPFHEISSWYKREWLSYGDSLKWPGTGSRDLYCASATVLRALEDKEHQGAMIASISVPWGEAWSDENQAGYHLVWPRDLYHVAQAFIAMGDLSSANRALDYLHRVQQKADGSVQQNTWIDGRPYWHNVQMDEVAFPLILAWRLSRFDLYTPMVVRAADYILEHGPASQQERWEENCGFSPSTIAAEIAGLVCAADMAQACGDRGRAQSYLEAADDWQANVEKWCFTTTGWHGTGRYYIRVSPTGNPNEDCCIELGSGAGVYDQREIVDAGFLELVRLGVKKPDNPYILESLVAVDEVLKVQTPNGPSWYRYNHDGYGEPCKDALYSGQGCGRLWTLLTGERAHYELSLGRDISSFLATMQRFAGPSLMLPEQVWEDTGQGTDSATPLAWSHAEYIRLLHSAALGYPVDRPHIVWRRYAR